MKDIGYYAGFLSSMAQKEITEASLFQLAHLLSEVSDDFSEDLISSWDYELLTVGYGDASPRDKLALIRGLCDRIEGKLTRQSA